MEKMQLNISKKDFIVLTAMVEFHFKFSEYIRENNQDLFYRAVDYAKTYTKTEDMSFDYWHEDNKRFLSELSTLMLKSSKPTKKDSSDMKNYILNFIQHSRELNYDAFDMIDWVNFINICKYIKDDDKFIDFAIAQITRIHGSETKLIAELKKND